MKEFKSAFEEIQPVLDDNGDPVLDEDGEPVLQGETDSYVEFKIDDHTLRAYAPTEGQLTFMLAALGRGQSKDQRFAAIINIMLASLRDDDRDYLESRLLTRDRSQRLPIKQIEEIFEFLAEEWFATPTPEPSGSAQ